MIKLHDSFGLDCVMGRFFTAFLMLRLHVFNVGVLSIACAVNVGTTQAMFV